jgi:hypothetical protein
MIIGQSRVPSFNLVSPFGPGRAASSSAATPSAAAGDHVTVSASGIEPGASEAAAAPSGKGQRSLLRTMVVGLALSASMIGMGGCSTMMMDTRMLPNPQQYVTGNEAHNAFNSISYLDGVAARDGGGIYDNSKEMTSEHQLKPLAALDRMMDGHEIVFKANKDAKAHPIRSWAELKGLEDMIRQQKTNPQPVPQIIQQHQ